MSESKPKTKKKTTKSALAESEVYPNSPLIEVVCELKFPSDMAIECDRDKFHNKIKHEYPEILFPLPKHGVAPSLQAYLFQDMGREHGVALATNRFAYFSKKYPGHKKFIAEMVKLYNIFNKTFGIKEIGRIGWRYINSIPFVREGDLIPINRFFNIDIHFPKAMTNEFVEINLFSRTQTQNGTFYFRLESVKNKNDGREALILDLDYDWTRKIKQEKIKEQIGQARKHSKEIFEEIINDSYREYLKGNTV